MLDQLVVSEPIAVSRRNTGDWLKHKANQAELWVVEFPGRFDRCIDYQSRVVFHVTRDAKVNDIAGFLKTRLHMDFALIQADPEQSKRHELKYIVSFIAGRSAKLDFNLEAMARRSVQCVRDWHFENERIARHVRESDKHRNRVVAN